MENNEIIENEETQDDIIEFDGNDVECSDGNGSFAMGVLIGGAVTAAGYFVTRKAIPWAKGKFQELKAKKSESKDDKSDDYVEVEE